MWAGKMRITTSLRMIFRASSCASFESIFRVLRRPGFAVKLSELSELYMTRNKKSLCGGIAGTRLGPSWTLHAKRISEVAQSVQQCTEFCSSISAMADKGYAKVGAEEAKSGCNPVLGIVIGLVVACGAFGGGYYLGKSAPAADEASSSTCCCCRRRLRCSERRRSATWPM